MKFYANDSYMILSVGDYDIAINLEGIRDNSRNVPCESHHVGYFKNRKDLSYKSVSASTLEKLLSDSSQYISSSKGRVIISDMAEEHLKNAVAKLEREKKTSMADYKKLVKEMGRRGL